MTKNLLLKIALTLTLAQMAMPSPAYADIPSSSVFFSNAELEEIEGKVETMRRENPSANADRINLGAIIYMNDDNWKIWLQGKVRTPQNRDASPRIVNVTPSEVTVMVFLYGSGTEQQVTLCPNQTYRISTGEIIEGF